MLCKYLISVVIFTVFMQAAPKLFESYGKKMELLNDNCKVYKKDKRIPRKIKKKCKVYASNVNKVFKYGYKLDASVKRDNINLDKAEKYNILLHDLEEKKDIIIHLINLEIRKAIKKSDIKYFKFLLSSLYVEIKPYEYDFMEKFKDSFNKYPKYIEHKEKLVLKREQAIKQRQYLIAKQNLIDEEEKRKKDIRDKQELIAEEEKRKELDKEEKKIKNLKLEAKEDGRKYYESLTEYTARGKHRFCIASIYKSNWDHSCTGACLKIKILPEKYKDIYEENFRKSCK